MLSLKRKVIVVAIVVCFISAIGGGVWGRLEAYLLTRSIPPGEMEVENLKALYGARLYDELIGECNRAERDVKYVNYRPQILYVKWATDRRLGHSDEAQAVEQQFLKTYPDHLLAGDIHFARAMNLLANADYAGAQSELRQVRDKYPGTLAAKKSADLLDRLSKVPKTTQPMK